MIRFACPACNKVMTAPIKQSGEVNPCAGCGQMVQVPPPDQAAYEDDERRKLKRQREGMRAFLALMRFFLWGVCLAIVVTSVIAFFQEIVHKDDYPAKTAFGVQALVWIFSAYLVARTFDSTTKSLEELCARFRGKRR
jgi:hypothetical protein